jgi:hypothetical protein
MPELSLDLAIALVLALILGLLIAIVILYSLRGRAETRRRLEQRGRVSQMLKRREEFEPPPEKLVAALEQVVGSIEKAAKSKRSMVKVQLDSKIELEAVASRYSDAANAHHGRVVDLTQVLGKSKDKKN